MRIGILCHPTSGGSGTIASQLAHGLAQRGHSVHLFTHGKPSKLRLSSGVKLHIARAMPYPIFEAPPHNLAVTSAVLDVHGREGLDLLHAHYAIPNATSALVARAAVREAGGDLPVVTTLHGTDVTLVGCDPTYAPLVRYAIEASDAVTTVSASLAKQTREAFLRGSKTRLWVIPNFVVSSPNTVRVPGQKPVPVNILHVSNFRPLKRVDWLLSAFHLAISQTGVPARLTLLGDGPERSRCEALVAELQLEDQVTFVGDQVEVSGALGDADIFALASEQESFGLASLEAMAAGLPIVSTNVGGIPEVVEDGACGFLSPPADLSGFAGNLVHLIEDPGLRAAFGRAGKQRSEKHFSPTMMVDRYEALYEEVLEK